MIVLVSSIVMLLVPMILLHPYITIELYLFHMRHMRIHFKRCMHAICNEFLISVIKDAHPDTIFSTCKNNLFVDPHA